MNDDDDDDEEEDDDVHRQGDFTNHVDFPFVPLRVSDLLFTVSTAHRCPVVSSGTFSKGIYLMIDHDQQSQEEN